MQKIDEQIKKNNPWYTGDQFSEQWQNTVAQRVIVNRWHIWEKMLASWRDDVASDSISSPLKVLDVGCGDGINLMGLNSILRNMSATFDLFGIDYNPLRACRARQRFQSVNIINADARQLPFKSELFQVILCNAVIEHIDEDVDVLHELRRVLHPSGIVIIGVPNEGCFMARMRNLMLQPQISTTTDHVNFYTVPKLLAKISDVGLVPIVLNREGFFFPHAAIGNLMYRFSIGRQIIKSLLGIFPGQAAEVICACRKENIA